jgi:hypothetical protein
MTQFLIGIGMILIAVIGFYILHRDNKPTNRKI